MGVQHHASATALALLLTRQTLLPKGKQFQIISGLSGTAESHEIAGSLTKVCLSLLYLNTTSFVMGVEEFKTVNVTNIIIKYVS